MSSEWNADRLDLGAYLHRIGQPDGPPTGATLDRLHHAHVATIGFDNLAIILGNGVDPDLDAVQHKLVRRGRGGYCYEHAVLIAAALERLGYRVERLLARIGHDTFRPRPRTHMCLRVIGTDGQWLADVGFGAGLLTPMPWTDNQQHQDGWNYRLGTEPNDTTRILAEEGPEGWVPLYSFTSEPVHASDVQMANHFTATHPSSPFVNRLVAMRRHAHHRIRLRGRTLQTTRSDGSHFEQNLSEEELGDILANEFDIHLTDRERSELTH